MQGNTVLFAVKFQRLRYQNESCSKCRKDVRQSLCQYVNRSICQYVRMQLFTLGIKMKVVQNVIRMSDSQMGSRIWLGVDYTKIIQLGTCDSLGVYPETPCSIVLKTLPKYVIKSNRRRGR